MEDDENWLENNLKLKNGQGSLLDNKKEIAKLTDHDQNVLKETELNLNSEEQEKKPIPTTARDEAYKAPLSLMSERDWIEQTALEVKSKNSRTHKSLKNHSKIGKNQFRGGVGPDTYLYYIRTGGTCFFLLILIVYVATVSSNLVAGWWLSRWAARTYSISLTLYIIIYLLINAFYILLIAARSQLLTCFCMSISSKIFKKVTWNVLIKPMRYFDTTPIGDILNRFTRDISVVDQTIVNLNNESLHNGILLATILVASSLISPLVLIVLVALGYVIYRAWVAYALCSGELIRESLRVDSLYLSKVTEIFDGMTVIGAYGVKNEIMRGLKVVHNHSVNIHFHDYCALIWLRLRVFVMVWTVLAVACFLIVLSKNSIK